MTSGFKDEPILVRRSNVIHGDVGTPGFAIVFLYNALHVIRESNIGQQTIAQPSYVVADFVGVRA